MTATTLHGAAGSARSDFGDLRGEFRALLATGGVYALGARAKISLTGGDRVRWLNGMTTNNVRDLAPGHGVYSFLLNPQGHILADIYAYNRGDSLLVDTALDQREKILQLFEHYIIMDDVEVANLSDKLTALGLAGPPARHILEKAGLQAPQLAPLQFADLQWRGIALTVACGDNPALPCYEIWLAPEHVPALWDALVRVGARPVGTGALELLRIASGLPRYGQDIRERDLPQETGQDRALHFSKGCYIGQEIVERVRAQGHVNKKLVRVEIEGGEALAPGSKLTADGAEAGEITSSVYSPAAEKALGLAIVRTAFAAAGSALESQARRVLVLQ